MNGPKFWNEVATRIDRLGINRQDWDIMITGGCVRDWYLGLTPKDIDVFVRQGTGQGVFGSRNIEGFEPSDGPQVADEYMGVGNIVEITNWKFVDTDIQIILINQDPMNHRDLFDAELLKGSYELDAGLRLPSQTLKDLDDKVVRLTRNATARSQERAERFLQKVGQVEEGWTINTEAYDQAQVQAAQPDEPRQRLPLDWNGIAAGQAIRPGQILNVVHQWAMPAAVRQAAPRIVINDEGLVGQRVEAVMVDELPLDDFVELR